MQAQISRSSPPLDVPGDADREGGGRAMRGPVVRRCVTTAVLIPAESVVVEVEYVVSPGSRNVMSTGIMRTDRYSSTDGVQFRQ